MTSQKQTAQTGNRAARFSNKQDHSNGKTLNFQVINSAAIRVLPIILKRWLPSGKLVGQEWTACNPTRMDRTPGSFKVNISTGRWAEFATGECGGDVISLAAYLSGLGQGAAARQLAAMLGVHHE